MFQKYPEIVRLSLSLFLSLSIPYNQSRNLYLTLRDRDRADTINPLLHHPRYFTKGLAELIGFSLSNQNSLYLLHLFYSDNEIITVRGRPAICTLIGWFKSSRLYISLSVSMELTRENRKSLNDSCRPTSISSTHNTKPNV